MANYINKLFIYRILVGLLLVSTLALGILVLRYEKSAKEPPSGSKPFIQKNLPHSAKVKAIIDPLRYSGLHDLLREDVFITLNFNERTWTMNNIHRFDKNGKVLLHENRYGVCGDLAAYTYDKIKPLFEDQYEIEFVKAAEASYFRFGKGTHYVLRLLDKSDLNAPVLVIDPSLHKYAPIDYFEDYLPIQFMDQLSFAQGQFTSETFPIGGGPPIIINQKGLLSITVGPVKNRFDKNNYRFAIFAAKRYNYISPLAYTIGRENGQIVEKELKKSLIELFNKKEYQQLKDRVQELFLDFEKNHKTQASPPTKVKKGLQVIRVPV